MNFSEMTVTELIGWICGGLVLLSAIIQIAPIKINPWSWIAKKIGRAINQEVLQKVDGLESELREMKEDQEELNAKNARTKILRFGDELLHDVKHSKDCFDDILTVITEYELYCESHPKFKNRMTERTVKHIIEIYDRCREEHTFL